MKLDANPQREISGDQQAEYESVGADVLVEYVRDDMKARVESLRTHLRNSLGGPHHRSSESPEPSRSDAAE